MTFMTDDRATDTMAAQAGKAAGSDRAARQLQESRCPSCRRAMAKRTKSRSHTDVWFWVCDNCKELLADNEGRPGVALGPVSKAEN